MASLARAGAQLDVSGAVEVSGTDLQVRVDLSNVGDDTARQVRVSGELFGLTDGASLEGELAAGQTQSAWLGYPFEPPRPGVHALLLHLDYSEGPPEADAQLSQRAFLLVALGGRVLSPVNLRVPGLTIGSHGTLEVGVESLDGDSHRVELRLALPRALGLLGETKEVEVPAAGEVSVPFTILRGHAAPGSAQGILVVARTLEGPMERATVVAATVNVVGNSGYLTRLRPVLLVLAAALLGGAVGFELMRRRPQPPAE